MITLTHLGLSFCPPVITSLIDTGSSKTLSEKMNLIWKRFSFMIANEFTIFNLSVEQRIQYEIDQIDKAQATESIPFVCSTIRKTFAKSIATVNKAGLNPASLPKKVALQFAVILTKFGIAMHNSGDDKLHASLDIFKAAILMHQYALGISKDSLDLSKLLILDHLYTNSKVYEEIRPLAERVIGHLKPHVWVASTFLLTKEQQLLIPQLLFYTEKTMHRLKHENSMHVKLLAETAGACLLAAKRKDLGR